VEKTDQLPRQKLASLEAQNQRLLRGDVPWVCRRHGRLDPGLGPLLRHAQGQEEGVVVRGQEEAVATATGPPARAAHSLEER
jgi:hypothetical protein